ncbi:hypothetical protein AVEN_234282-1 [Araneus ventricosus]|uniref:Uncharacterized protein n=1 Tax=Araneus ventricosus TaxID=182803 RepID=A0A4Y2A8R4_ARAVE|nr:hypothetical protein AVEN_234282-1 [Araneus ventricosus]
MSRPVEEALNRPCLDHRAVSVLIVFARVDRLGTPLEFQRLWNLSVVLSAVRATRSRPAHLNDSHCNSSSSEAGILVALTGHGSTPPVGGTHYYRQWETEAFIVPTREARPACLSGGLSFTYSWCPLWDCLTV